jgi:hypothetical protein
VAERARHAAFGGITPRSGVGASEACVPGAEREKFSPLNFSRDCKKFSSANFSQRNFHVYSEKFSSANFPRALIYNSSVAKPC